MAIDSITLTAALRELAPQLEGARIDKIQQPERDVLIFTVRTSSGNRKLLISAGSGSARIHFTTVTRDNPAAAPMFCMLLRKHLSGARIAALEQPYLERMCTLNLEVLDQLGRQVTKKLVIEMMGKSANIILCDEEGRIIDCIRKVDSDMSEKRQVLPGLFYREPPADRKNDLFSLDAEAVRALSAGACGEIQDWIRKTFTGFSPVMAREAAFRSAGSADADFACAGPDFPEKLKAFADGIFPGAAPYLITENGRPADISCVPVMQYGTLRSCERAESFSKLLDGFYTGSELARRTAQRAQTTVKLITNLRDRTARKLQYQREELRSTDDREYYRRCGDIIQANLYRIERGARVLVAEDFYAPEPCDTEIPLDPRLSPHKNAEKYYKKYTKAKNARIVLSEQIREGEKELEYLESVLDELERASGERELEDIRSELTEGGYIHEKDRKQKQNQTGPMKFVSSSGIAITVGRNNRQNDSLTFKNAFRSDMWLHAQKIHGSHVIISSDEPDETTLLEAASLAAYYSQGRDSNAVDVDYTQARHVKKPSGAKPGMVIYTDYKTVRVRPADALRLINR